MNPNIFPDPQDPDYVEKGSFDQVPSNVSVLARAPDENLPCAEIVFRWHPATQHTAIANFQPPSYYEDYLMTNSYSAVMQRLQESQMAKLARLHDGGEGLRSFVEIGCGDGSFLKHAARHASRVVGIEPSRRFAEEAKRAGFEVIVGYVGSRQALTPEKFDGFASRQVFEHLPDPADVLRGIRLMLRPGAVGLIEVPNGQRSLRRRRFYDFFPDHVNYYSVNSLVALASATGFSVVECGEAFGGDYLELWLRHEPAQDAWFADIAERRRQVCTQLAAKIRALADAGERIAVWGCGAKTLSILPACGREFAQRLVAAIDSDPHKHGRYLPNTAVPVVSPEQGADFRPTVVLVLALSYREEIAAAARQILPSCRLILTIDDEGTIAEL